MKYDFDDAKQAASQAAWDAELEKKIKERNEAMALQAELKHRAECFPDLLAALQWVNDNVHLSYTVRIKGQNEAWCDGIDSVRATIKKATGEV